MEKIVLKNIYLLNWYGFVGVTIPVDEDLTFITGENESGKSTILDAFKYAFIGDTEFNKSSGAAKRDLKSYTRCLVDPTKNTYARPAEKYPTVYTHIALEFRDELNKKNMVLGVVIETSPGNDVTSIRYRVEDILLKDIEFTYTDGSKTVPYSARKLCEKYHVPQMQVSEGLEDFMNAVGLRLSKNYRDDYKRKLRNMMTYRAESRIPEFMKKFVLEDKPVDFKKLKESKKNIEQLNEDLKNIREELSILDNILRYFNEYENITARLLLDDVKDVYEQILVSQHIKGDKKKKLEKNNLRISEIEGLLPGKEAEKQERFTELTDAQQRLKEIDGQKAIEDEEQKKNRLEQDLGNVSKEQDKLHGFQCVVNGILEKQYFGEDEIDEAILSNLEGREYDVSSKKYAVSVLKEKLELYAQKLDKERGAFEYQLKTCDDIILLLNKRLQGLNKNQINYSNVGEQAALIREINKEFERLHIDSTAKMACEFVLDIEEEWQDAIESFLNRHRYAIIVEPEYFEIADGILNKSNHKHVELVRTKALYAWEQEVYDDAVIHKLHLNNPTAKKYFEFWMGRIHAVDNNQVAEYDSALSKEGKISRNMAVSYLDFSKLREYCLGLSAIEKTRKIVADELEEEQKKEKELLELISKNDIIRHDLSEYLKAFKDYEYDAAYRLLDLQREISEISKKIHELQAALKDNMEYITLSRRVSEAESNYKQIEEQIKGLNEELTRLNVDNKHLNEDLKKLDESLQEKEANIDRMREEHPEQIGTALEECRRYNYLTIKDNKRASETHARDDRRKRELEGTSIPTEQRKYNSRKNPTEYLPIGIESESEYQKRRQKIQIDDLDKLQTKMKEQTRKYESIFKNDFCTKVYQAAQDALHITSEINKELRKLSFSTKYEFDIHLISDGSDFAKILEFSEYLEKTNSKDIFQMTLPGLLGYSSSEMDDMEKSIIEIINRLSSKADEDEEILRFSDYRNYLQYEIKISNEDIPDGKLSKQIGYNSGAATQIPYLLILAASLSMFYNQRENCARLAFIDEPFEKMSDDNIKKMLEFFKQQKFQVILCAPSNKMDSIGTECNTIVPVLKMRNDCMMIGKVQFNGNT